MHPRFAVVLPFLCALAIPAGAAVSDHGAREALRRLPLRFEANVGQWKPQVRFSARSGGAQLFLTERQATLTAKGQAVSMSLLRSNPHPTITPCGKMDAPVSYFVGRGPKWRTGVAQYTSVKYGNVYPGIDVVYYGSGAQLEYDFVLQANADPSRIRIQFGGAGRVLVNPDGDLVVETATGQIVQKKPYIYQMDGAERRTVAGRYRMLGPNVAGVTLEAYNRAQPVTIDPVLTYSTLLGGETTDSVVAVAIRNGLIYVAGNTGTSDLPGFNESFAASSLGGSEGFLAVLNPLLSGASSLRYFTYVGGSADDVINAMTLDGVGNVYLAGSTKSIDFPLGGVNVTTELGGILDTNDTDTASRKSYSDGFMLKMNPGLEATEGLIYGTYLGGKYTDVATAVAVDTRGKILVAGTTQSTNFPVSDTAYAGVLYGTQDAFLCWIDPDSDGPLWYGTYFGGELIDDVRTLTVNSSEMVYIGGSTVSTLLPTKGSPYRGSLQGDSDAYLAVFNPYLTGDASLVYSTYIGGSGAEEVRAMMLDSEGKVLLTGYTLSTDFPTTPDAYRTYPGGKGDIFLMRFDPFAGPDSAVLYSTYFGGNGGDVAYGIALDSAGTVWLSGYTLSTNLPLAGSPLQSSNNGGVEVLIANLDITKPGSAALKYSTYVGSTGVNVGFGIAVGSDGTIVVGGVTSMKNVKTTTTGYQPDFAGGTSDGFVMVLN
jgi:hypothetical protein